jgi:hypothetical protein
VASVFEKQLAGEVQSCSEKIGVARHQRNGDNVTIAAEAHGP